MFSCLVFHLRRSGSDFFTFAIEPVLSKTKFNLNVGRKFHCYGLFRRVKNHHRAYSRREMLMFAPFTHWVRGFSSEAFYRRQEARRSDYLGVDRVYRAWPQYFRVTRLICLFQRQLCIFLGSQEVVALCFKLFDGRIQLCKEALIVRQFYNM